MLFDMKVFTNKLQLNRNYPHWGKIGTHLERPNFVKLYKSFDALYPNKLKLQDHPLDYCLVLETEQGDTVYQMGYFWGDETYLEAANYWCSNFNLLKDFVVDRWVVNCDDDQHPVDLSITLLSPSIPGLTKIGYYLMSDPSNLVKF
jgi:hypothetical protein